MPELRWTLLVLGVGFLAALAWWELRRPRQAAHREHLNEPGVHAHSPPEPLAPEDRREPALGLPEIGVAEAVREPPIVEIADDSMIGLRLDGHALEPVPVVLEEDAEAIVPSESTEIESVSADADADADADAEPESESEPLPAPTEMTPDPIVEWPDEPTRRIVAIRIIAHMDRFPGHAVRQALAAEGFVLGKFSIFHRAGPDGRAVMSVAGLNKPGTFDPDSIDLQRFGGLNLFTVLPGPLAADQAFDELLGAARNLNDRLQGALQDERGDPLTPVRAASIRESLSAEPP
jgi:FtsZ-interacting cell division protein ZipA